MLYSMVAPVIGYSEAFIYAVTLVGSPGLGYAILRLSESGIRAWPKQFKHGWAWTAGMGITAFAALTTFLLESFIGRPAEAFFPLILLVTASGLTVAYRLKVAYLPSRHAEISLPRDYLQTRAAVAEGKLDKVPERVMRQELLPLPTPQTVAVAEKESKVAGILGALKQTLTPEPAEMPEIVSLEELAKKEQSTQIQALNEQEAKTTLKPFEELVHRRERRQLELKTPEPAKAEPSELGNPLEAKTHAHWRGKRRELDAPPSPAPPAPVPAPYSVFDAVKHSSHSEEKKAEVEGKVTGILSQLKEGEKPKHGRRGKTYAAPIVAEPEESHRRRYLMTTKRKWSEEAKGAKPGPITPPLEEEKPVKDINALMATIQEVSGKQESLSMEDVHKAVKDEGLPTLKEIEGLDSAHSHTQTVKNPEKNCPYCHTASNRYILCTHCGQTFCTNCSASVNFGDATIDYACPKCKQVNKVAKKPPGFEMEEMTELE